MSVTEGSPPPPRDRAEALARHPPALQRALADPHALRWRQDGLDDALIGVVRIGEQDDHVYLERVVWSFDEDRLRWVVESNELWELPRDVAAGVAHGLARLLGAGAAPEPG